MPVQQEPFGKTHDGRAVERLTLTAAGGIEARFITYGARLSELHVPDRAGDKKSVVLGFDSLPPYLASEPYFGAMIGRVANRIANGQFSLNGRTYTLSKNNNGNTLHGGKVGFDKHLWQARVVSDSPAAVEFTYVSPDMQEGFPGEVHARVRCTLTQQHALRIEYDATTTAPTPINLTNHSYFNLAGAGRGNVLNHTIEIAAESYTPVNDKLIPTGQIVPVAGTPLDFRAPTAIGERIKQTPSGYDFNFVLERPSANLALTARVSEPTTGRRMEVWSSQPGVQFYSGNFLDGSNVGIGGAYEKYGGLCLEPQHYPDSVNHPNFPNSILQPGKEYRHVVEFRFFA